MITGYIRGQELTVRSPTIAADSIDYLTAHFVFQTKDWDGFRKFTHWKCGDVNHTVELHTDRIDEEQHLNLTAGTWNVWIHGERYQDGKLIQRITTDEAAITVKATGSVSGSPFPEAPASDIERINAEIDEIKNLLDQGGGGISFRPGNALELMDGVLNVVTTDEAEVDNTLPITSAGVHTIIGNISAILDTI